MRRQLAAAFFAGVVACILLSVIAFQTVLEPNEPASAQDAGTWQMVEFNDWIAGETPRGFIEQLPADCDLVPDPHDEWVMFYRCPEPFEPNDRPYWSNP